MSDKSSAAGGFGIGSIIAAIISYAKWHSIGYAILHGILGWFYVIYYLIAYGWPEL